MCLPMQDHQPGKETTKQILARFEYINLEVLPKDHAERNEFVS